MQKLFIGILALTTVALGVLCVMQRKELRAANDKLQGAEQARVADTETREMQVARVKELERNEARLEKQLQEFTKVTTSLRVTEARQSSNLTTFAERMSAAKSKGGPAGEGDGALGKGMGEMLGKMMKDPAMREMMREQQKVAINMMYSGLFKDLNLSPEEKEKFKTLLTDAQMKNLDSAQGLFGGEDKQGSAEAIAKQTAEAKTQTDAEIKALLGDERFAIYEDYQKNMGERMQLDQFKSQIAAENMPLRDDQAVQLSQIMKEEKAAVPPIIPTDQTQMPTKEQLTAENLEKQMQWMEDYNRRVLARAQSVLSPDQFKQYQTFQEQQLSMQKLGMNMARQMFGGEKSGSAPAAPPPQ
ncbi:MAG TPA: hypothetical protein VNT99_03185 [Methylomirabilota bacterium]|nr:hypothetical protein [Methylomirabilota bacterium]